MSVQPKQRNRSNSRNNRHRLRSLVLARSWHRQVLSRRNLQLLMMMMKKTKMVARKCPAHIIQLSMQGYKYRVR